MKIPNYIRIALERRARTAEAFMEADKIVSAFLDKNGIEADPADYDEGAEALFDPWGSVKRIEEAIEEK